MNHLSLFSGIGGLDLAAEMAGFTTVGQCEWADYPTKVLEKHWPDVPRWRDIRALTGGSFFERTGLQTVDVISGGFPCQPFSVAGKRRGKEDDRYLWPEMLRVISELRPTWVVGENVAGIINMALDTVLADLEGEGYATGTLVLPACGVDAPHRRYRVAIVGYAEHDGLFAPAQPGGAAATGGDLPQRPEAAGEPPRAGVRGNGAALADAESGRLFRYGSSREQISGTRPEKAQSERRCDVLSDTDNRGWTLWRNWELSTTEETATGRADFGGRAPEYVTGEWWPAEPNVGRVAHGVPSRVDRLKCLGNAVVPQQFYPIFKAIALAEQWGGICT